MVVDIVIVIALVVALVIGLQVGFFAGLGWIAGLFAGGAVAPWLAPIVNDAVPDRAWRGVAVVATVIALLVVGAVIGSALGRVIRRGADRIKLRFVERLLGGVLSVVATGLALSLASAAIATAGIPVVSSSVASSAVLRTIDRITPPPVASALAELRSAVLDDTLPTIDGLLGPGFQGTPEPQIDTGSPALDASAASVARISGVAYACGTSSTGSGFVAQDDRVVTNAHVVAGVDSVVVELPNEPARDGRVVYFDPVDDLAVIAVDVEADPLAVVDPLQGGDSAAVQGYPHGGPFETGAASVISVGPSEVADIYGESSAARDMYALAAEVVPGNSGGPLLTTSGEVAGVVFARDEARDDVGYAMTTAELAPVLGSLDDATAPVETGRCMS